MASVDGDEVTRPQLQEPHNNKVPDFVSPIEN
jgi:hypothetical protein